MAGLQGPLPSQTATQQHYYGANTTNLRGPNANGTGDVPWVPEIFSKNVLIRFRRESVAEGITNNDYFGEIANYGDSVRIIKEPTITVSSYSRGETVSSTAFQDDELTLVLDQAHKFQFQVDDIEDKLAHVNWEQLASSAATFEMKMAYDINVLNYFRDQMLDIQFRNRAATADFNDLLVRRVAQPATLAAAADANAVSNLLKTAANSYILGFSTTVAGTIDPLNYLSQLALYLDKQDVPAEGRFVVVPPEFIELLHRVDSSLVNYDWGSGPSNIRNGLVAENVRGFMVFKTNNSPTVPANGTDATNFIVAGHKSAIATANSIVQTEKFRSQTTFADVIRGLHVFGRALVREEALVGGFVRFEAPNAA